MMTAPIASHSTQNTLGNELAGLCTLDFPPDITPNHVHDTLAETCKACCVEFIERQPGIDGISDIYELLLPPLRNADDHYPQGFSLVVMVTTPHRGSPVSLTMHGAHRITLSRPDETALQPLNDLALARLRSKLWQPLERLAHGE